MDYIIGQYLLQNISSDKVLEEVVPQCPLLRPIPLNYLTWNSLKHDFFFLHITKSAQKSRSWNTPLWSHSTHTPPSGRQDNLHGTADRPDLARRHFASGAVSYCPARIISPAGRNKAYSRAVLADP